LATAVRHLLGFTLLAAAACSHEGTSGEENLGLSCTGDDEQISCPHATMVRCVGPANWSPRDIHFQVPAGDPPEAGWPVVIFFQGSFVSAGSTWTSRPGDAFGAFSLTQTYARLLEQGFAVIAPETRLNGGTYWDTNVPPFSWDWELSDDHELMQTIFDEIEGGGFGDLDPDALYAMGISSGGYMTSRMAVSYAGRFRALAVHSASYATCSGPICDVPDELDPGHPPTLFLHGGDDLVVDVGTAEEYAAKLDEVGIETEFVRDDDGGHVWLRQAVEAIPNWFERHSNQP
jgi:predicted esterase